MLLLIFGISSTPKIYFHDLVADHKDASGCEQIHTTTALHNQGYNCHFDDLVVSSPFIVQTAFSISLSQQYFKEKLINFISSYCSSVVQYKESRGPPFA